MSRSVLSNLSLAVVGKQLSTVNEALVVGRQAHGRSHDHVRLANAAQWDLSSQMVEQALLMGGVGAGQFD
jgi:hypothetical protein